MSRIIAEVITLMPMATGSWCSSARAWNSRSRGAAASRSPCQ